MIDTKFGAARALLLAIIAIVSLNPSAAHAQAFTGSSVTSGPFSSGMQDFYDTSRFNASAAGSVTGGIQIFSNSSALNASAADAISGGDQAFTDMSALNASATGAIAGGAQQFYTSSALNASAADAISGGIQFFYFDSTLNASAAGAIGGGTQRFQGTSRLNASAANAVNGGIQHFDANSALNAVATKAIKGGFQYFYDTSTLNASAANAIDGGTQIFSGDSRLNASASGAISGGDQHFASNSALHALANNAISGGIQRFDGNSVLNAFSSGAVNGGFQRFFGDIVLNVLADHDLSATTNIYFDKAGGGTGGTLRLNGNSTTIGGFASVTAGSGAIVNGGAANSVLTVSMPSSFLSTRFSGTIADGAGVGTLALIVSGGRLTLTGTASHTGGTTVSGGTLLVGDASGSGTLGGSVDVTNGGTLGGSGTIGSGAGSLVTVASGGTLSPGNSIGTLKVDGDLVFAASARLVVEVNPAGNESDLVAVSGNATLNGGSVAHIGATGAYDLLSTYRILSAGGTLTGTFDDVSSDFAFLTPNLIYDFAAGTVDLALARNSRDFASAASTRNQIATASGIESIGFGAGHAVYDAIAQLPDDDDLVRASFDALSGEIHASARSVLIEDSRFVRGAINDRLRAAFEGVGNPETPVLAYGEGGPLLAAANSDRFAAWGSAFGAWGAFDGDGNAAGLDASTGGLLTGIDGLITDDVRLGIMAGYSHTSFDAAGRTSSGSSNNYHLGLYGGTQWGALAFRSGLAYSWHDISTSRSVVMPGFTDSLSGGYTAGTFQAFGELGYRIDTELAAFEPFANLAHVNFHANDFWEAGGAAALIGRGQTSGATFATLGIRASSVVTLGTMAATVRGMLGWRHAYGDINPESTHAFSAGNAFTVAGVPIAKDAALIEAGLDLNLTPAATLGVSYQGQFGSGVQQNGFSARLAVKF